MSDKGIREFCQIALAREFTTPERVKEVIADCVRAQKAGKEVPVGEIFMIKEYLDRKQVVEIMKELYGETSIVPAASPDDDDLPAAPKGNTVTPIADEPTPAAAPSGPVKSPWQSDRPARPDPTVWILRAALLPGVFAAVFLALLAHGAATRDRGPGLPTGQVPVALGSDLVDTIRVVRTEWADADGKGRLVLLVHYEFPGGFQTANPPAEFDVVALREKSIIERVRVPFHQNVEALRQLSEEVGQERLFGALLRDRPSGILVVPLSSPALVDTIVLTSP